MLDIQLIRDNAEAVRKNLARREHEHTLTLLISVQELDRRWRSAKYESDQLASMKNTISLEINQLRKEGKDPKQKRDELQLLSQRIEHKRNEETTLKQELDATLIRLPNLLAPDVPYGNDASKNALIRDWGKPKKPGFELKPHAVIAEKLNIADFEKSTTIAGAGFYTLKGTLAHLNQALIRYAIDTLTNKGYEYIEPPLMMNKKAYEGVTDLTDFETMMYKIDGEDLYLIATSEHPLVALWTNEVIPEETLPIKLVGLSPCFRKEIGAHGIDERGLFRRHQFWKVEQVILCKPEDSARYHEELIQNAESLWKGLRIPYRVVNICTGDIGSVAAKKYDIEAWMPRTQEYKEVVSGSNCTDYQARRLNIRFGKQGGHKELVHTLNCTGIATSRALVAILENYQNKDGSVKIPSILKKYMKTTKLSVKD
ncbi:MAG: serine--tRNA ligase [Nanoarchaeota archaeon]